MIYKVMIAIRQFARKPTAKEVPEIKSIMVPQGTQVSLLE